eukprot:6912622-Pyramimonas_sp.AAC.1
MRATLTQQPAQNRVQGQREEAHASRVPLPHSSFYLDALQAPPRQSDCGCIVSVEGSKETYDGSRNRHGTEDSENPADKEGRESSSEAGKQERRVRLTMKPLK